ncbi:cupin domain-containing protein [Aeromicrobium fastidiosum]|uniref:Cupin domain-containing protein n=1 Tax=Aeromicrobium fastidiosum TaxID=52699 RepID=A0A641ANY2_9ACTN|nr:cupin domain-containing protein [Aeromicrobium fastidiosum]KAA1379790.1 cupin domain-containing protein [Aeromicrobium fastidiosum]MBP2389282.1 putative cupin superfamily protein [Aeromicrobium fastidiosum]
MTGHELATERLLAQDALAVPIEHAPVQDDDVLGGHPTMGAETLHTHGDVELGVWEITSGVVKDTEVEEMFVVLSGRGLVELADGSSIPLAAGTVVRLRAGDRTRWIVYETLRKIYVLLPDHEEPTP